MTFSHHTTNKVSGESEDNLGLVRLFIDKIRIPPSIFLMNSVLMKTSNVSEENAVILTKSNESVCLNANKPGV